MAQEPNQLHEIIPRHISYVTLKIIVLKTRTRIDLGLQYAYFLKKEDEIINIFDELQAC